MGKFYVKTNRTFSAVRKYGWLFTLLVAMGGLWEPKLGLLVILIMAGLTVTAFFSGRYWCGNYCPHGSLFDRILLPLSQNRKIPTFLKSKIMIGTFFIFFMFNFARRILDVASLWGNLTFIDRLGFVFVTTYLMVFVVGGLLAVFITPRTWCQFCPMGTLQKFAYSLGKMLGVAKRTDRKVTIACQEKCHACGKCSRVCPFQLTPHLQFSAQNQFDDLNCIKCATCVENCPAGILSIDTEQNALTIKENTSAYGYSNRQKIQAKITSIADLKEDTKEYTFAFISPKEVDYQAGQFVLVKIEDNPTSYRAYSISSYNEDNRQLSVIIKKVENGYGTGIIFNSFKVGNIVELVGPMGNELLLDREAGKLLFVANGIGITPFIPLVKDVLLNQPAAKEVKLLYGARYDDDFLYEEYFRQLDNQYEQFSYIPVISRPENSNERKGHVTDLLNEMTLTGYKVYMCGTRNMVVDSYKLLLSKGVKREDIFYQIEEKIKDLESIASVA